MAVVKFEKRALGSSLYGTIFAKKCLRLLYAFFKNAKIAQIVRLLASELLLKTHHAICGSGFGSNGPRKNLTRNGHDEYQVRPRDRTGSERLFWSHPATWCGIGSLD
jgi:hypothetical protein